MGFKTSLLYAAPVRLIFLDGHLANIVIVCYASYHCIKMWNIT